MNSNAMISSLGIFVLPCFIEETWCRSLSCVCAYALVCAQNRMHLCVHRAICTCVCRAVCTCVYTEPYALVCAQIHMHLCVHRAVHVYEPLCKYREEGKCWEEFAKVFCWRLPLLSQPWSLKQTRQNSGARC